jgi:hypothetical protein
MPLRVLLAIDQGINGNGVLPSEAAMPATRSATNSEHDVGERDVA